MDLRARFEQALAAHRAGRLDEAEKLGREILRADPGAFPVLHLLGFIAAQRGRFDLAVTLLERAVAAAPGELAAQSHYAHALLGAGRQTDALTAFDNVLARDPGAIDALYNRGVILSELGRPQEALASFDRALALQPNAPGTLYNRGVALAELGRYQDALANYDRALALQPDLMQAAANRAFAALNLCDWARMDEIRPTLSRFAAPPLTVLGYTDDKALQQASAAAVIQTEIPAPNPPLWRGERYRHDRIRLGYVSFDFNEHAVGIQIAPLIKAHDRSRFEVIAISIGGEDHSANRALLKNSFDQFHDMATLNSDVIARRMREMEIDIAIDLGGHTKGARPRIFSWRPAPVQAGWLGYPGTSGAPFMDYVIADPVVAPFEHQPFYSEKLVHLPDTYFPPGLVPAPAAAPSRADMGLPDEGFVFCSFNNGWKFTRPVFDVWMRLLAAVPGSVLWLKAPNDGARRNLAREAAARGIDPARLVYAGFAPTDLHLARHALADLFLDTLPYNAHATAAHALWAGLPVVTCKGEAFAARVGASLLTAIGLPELVTENLTDYEALALTLAREPQALQAIKTRLVQARATAPLFDVDRFRTHIEGAYTAMLENAGQPPRPISVR